MGDGRSNQYSLHLGLHALGIYMGTSALKYTGFWGHEYLVQHLER